MKRRTGTRVIWIAAAVAAAASMALGAGSASAGSSGDAFYLSQSKNTFVSFKIGSGSNQVTKLGYTARKLPCDKGKPLKGMAVFGLGQAPIQENLLGQPFFESFWAPGVPGWGGISGKIRDTSVKGSLFLQATRKVDHKTVWCRTGYRTWTAKPVSEETWLAAREEQGYIEELRTPR